ncbi:MAG: hypothetical protein U0930_15320 [Pirellulales bacterium]
MTRRKRFSKTQLRGLAGRNDQSGFENFDSMIHRATAPRIDRNALQLCRQIQRELTLILSGELDDDRVRDLMVLSVSPYPHTNLLLVTLQAGQVCTQEELLDLDAALLHHKHLIRSEVASAINRKKTPDLTFRVINPV